MSILSYLNKEQKKAIENLEGPTLILAGAGSGKTATLTARTAKLLQKGVTPESILTLTFTNKAASEMKERIIKAVGQKAERVWMGTFHSVAYRILSRNLSKVNRRSNVLIYDQNDSEDIVSDLVTQRNLSKKRYKPKDIFSIINKAKMNMVPPGKMVENYANQDSFGSKKYYEIAADIYKDYEKELDNNNAFDFTDLLKKCVEMFREYPMTLRRYQERFKYIQLDEYQDSNTLNYLFANMLAKPHNNIFVVGDDRQSIYGFRGADITNILEFEKDYPNAQIHKLKRNYRSKKNIVEASNYLISHNEQNKNVKSWTDSDSGDKIKVIQTEYEYKEAHVIADNIVRLVNKEGYDYDDITILYRSNYQSLPFERVFTERKIPHQIVGGVGFWDRIEIKHFVNYLRLVVNPNDELTLKRMLKRESHGIGSVMLSRMKKHAESNNMEITEVMENPTVVKGIGKKRAEGIINFKTRVIDKLQNLKDDSLDIKGKIKKIYDGVNYKKDFVHTLDKVEKRMENVKEFFNLVYDYNKGNPDHSIQEFLLNVTLSSDQDDLDEEQKKVKLMTVHASKGLEFPNVFVVGLEEETFPHYLSVQEEMSGENPYAIEEERRLMYVAMTRAEDKLFLTYCDSRKKFGQYMNMSSSRFLEELPEDKMERIIKF